MNPTLGTAALLTISSTAFSVAGPSVPAIWWKMTPSAACRPKTIAATAMAITAMGAIDNAM